MELTVELALQILTLIVAGVGPVLAFRYAKRLALAGNRQAWLDGLRADVAELISHADVMAFRAHDFVNRAKDQRGPEREEGLRQTMGQLQILRFRIRLRLRSGNPRHDRLINAVEAFVCSNSVKPEERDPLRAEVVDATEVIVRRVWETIEKGR